MSKSTSKSIATKLEKAGAHVESVMRDENGEVFAYQCVVELRSLSIPKYQRKAIKSHCQDIADNFCNILSRNWGRFFVVTGVYFAKSRLLRIGSFRIFSSAPGSQPTNSKSISVPR